MTYIKPRTLLAATALALAGLAAAQDAAQRLPTTRLTAGFHVITAEVAGTPDQRSTGLIHRPSMPANHRILFVFERPGQQCFWMKNTLLPLSIAFLADDGTVVNIEDMQPQSLDSHCSKKPVRFALEMNKGWFARRAIQPGARLSGAPFGN